MRALPRALRRTKFTVHIIKVKFIPTGRWLSVFCISFVINLCSTKDAIQSLMTRKKKETHDQSLSFVVTPETIVIFPNLFLRMMLPDGDDAKTLPL